MLELLAGGASVGVLAAADGRVLVRGAGAGGGSFDGLPPFFAAGGGADVRRASGARPGGAALGRTLVVRARVALAGLIESLLESFIESRRAIPDARMDWLALAFVFDVLGPALGLIEGGAFEVMDGGAFDGVLESGGGAFDSEGGAFEVREVREVVFAGIVTSRAAAAPVRRCVVARLFVWSSEPPARRPRGDEPPKPATSARVPARHAT